MFHKIWVITKEQIAENPTWFWKASLFWYLFETENQINLYKNITQLQFLLLTPIVWEMWTHVNTKRSGLRQKTMETYLSELRGPQRCTSFIEEAINDHKQS